MLNESRYVTDYLMRTKKIKKDGTTWWTSVPWQKRIKIPEPPSQVIDVGKGGRKYLEVYRLGEDEYAYLRDKSVDMSKIKAMMSEKAKLTKFLNKFELNKDNAEFKKENSEKADKARKRMAVINEDIKQFDGTLVINAFKPFSTVQRQVIIAQFARAEEQRQKNIFKEAVVPAVAILSFAIIIIMLMVFWGDLAKPALDSHGMALEMQKENMRLAQQLGVYNGGQIAQEPQAESNSAIISQTEDPPNQDG